MSERAPQPARLDCAPSWAEGFVAWQPESIAPIRRVEFSLRELADRVLIDPAGFKAFVATTGLADVRWRLLWAEKDGLPDRSSVGEAVRQAR